MNEKTEIKMYLETRIKYYEQKLQFIEGCLLQQRELPVDKPRDKTLINLLNRSQTAYRLCKSELKILLQMTP